MLASFCCVFMDLDLCKRNLAIIQLSWPQAWSISHIYYMASSLSGQDERNPALWLAIRVGKLELSYLLGTTHCVQQEKIPRKPYNKSIIDQLVRSRWLDISLVLFLRVYWPQLCFGHKHAKKKILANIQPFWPHAWSITYIYIVTSIPLKFYNLPQKSHCSCLEIDKNVTLH